MAALPSDGGAEMDLKERILLEFGEKEQEIQELKDSVLQMSTEVHACVYACVRGSH